MKEDIAFFGVGELRRRSLCSLSHSEWDCDGGSDEVDVGILREMRPGAKDYWLLCACELGEVQR